MLSGFLKQKVTKLRWQDYFFGILFLINTIDSSIITAKRGRIIHEGNSGTVGVGEGVVFGEELAVGAGVADEVEVGTGVEDGLGEGDGVDVAAVKSILT